MVVERSDHLVNVISLSDEFQKEEA